MIFDKLCGLVERHLKQMMPVLRQAQLFVFEGDARTDLPAEYTEEDLKIFSDQFTLPFKTVAVEDAISCILFQDLQEKQIGVHTRRNFIECTPMSKEIIHLGRDDNSDVGIAMKQAEEMAENIRNKWGEVYTVTMGSMEMTPGKLKNNLRGDVTGSFFMSKEHASLLPQSIAEKHDQATIINVSAGMEELIALNTMDRFVVERSPETRPHCSRVAKRLRHRLPRSHQRPLYTLLTPKQIFEKFGVAQPEASDGTPLDRKIWRRRHWRFYKHERYTEERRDRPQLIDSTWVGPTEATLGRHRYKVRLDL